MSIGGAMRDVSSSRLVPASLALWLQPFREGFTAPTWEHVLVLIVGGVLTPGDVPSLPPCAWWGSSRRWTSPTITACSTAIAGQAVGSLDVCSGYWSITWSRTARSSSASTTRSSGDGVPRSKPGASIETRSALRMVIRQGERPAMVVDHAAARDPIGGDIWALPFLTVLAPSERYARKYKRRHKKLTDWGRQVMLQVARWLGAADHSGDR